MIYVENWENYAPYFTEREFKCRHTGKCLMDKEYMDMLFAIRVAYGSPMYISSGYRHWSHPAEARKGSTTGEHTTGRCSDVKVHGDDAVRLLRIALHHGIVRVGVMQHGDVTSRFLHLGLGGPGLPTPWIWDYSV